MKNKLLYKLRSGKNPKFIYYSVNALRLVIPKGIFTKESIYKFYEKKLIEYLDSEFEEYCTCDEIGRASCRERV